MKTFKISKHIIAEIKEAISKKPEMGSQWVSKINPTDIYEFAFRRGNKYQLFNMTGPGNLYIDISDFEENFIPYKGKK